MLIKRFWGVFALRASALGLIFSVRLDGRKDIQPVKSTRSVFHAELETRVLTSLGITNDVKRTRTMLFLLFIVAYLELPQFSMWNVF